MLDSAITLLKSVLGDLINPSVILIFV